MKILKTVGLITILGLMGTIPFTLTAWAAGNPGPTLTVNQNVSAGDEASYRLFLKNDDARIHKYALAYGQLPQGFQAYFLLNQKTTKDLDLLAQASSIVEFHVLVPASATAGTTISKISLRRDDGQLFTVPLSLTINRDHSLSIINQVKGLQVINGQNVDFQIAVSNTGSKKAKQVGLKLELPYKWVAELISPQDMSLQPGESGVFKVQLAVPPTQAAGLNQVKVVATVDGISSPATLIPITVQSNHNNLIWVLALITAAGLTTAFYFRKHGRR